MKFVQLNLAAKPDPFDFQVVIPPETAVGAALELSVVFKANPHLTDLVWHIPDLDEPLYAIPPPENWTEVDIRYYDHTVCPRVHRNSVAHLFSLI